MHDWDISYDQTLENLCSKNYKKFYCILGAKVLSFYNLVVLDCV